MITIIIMAKAHFGRKRGDAERNDDDGKLYFCSCAASAADDDELCEPTCPAKGQVGLEWNGMDSTASVQYWTGIENDSNITALIGDFRNGKRCSILLLGIPLDGG